MEEDVRWEVLDALDPAGKRELADTLPWPFSGMVNDVTTAIEGGALYLAALGLICYTEQCGRMICRGGKRGNNYECFAVFVSWMNPGAFTTMMHRFSIDGVIKKPFEVIRHGLVHNYGMDLPRSAVCMITDDPLGNKSGFLFSEEHGFTMAVVPYFNLFCSALSRLREKGELGCDSAGG